MPSPSSLTTISDTLLQMHMFARHLVRAKYPFLIRLVPENETFCFSKTVMLSYASSRYLLISKRGEINDEQWVANESNQQLGETPALRWLFLWWLTKTVCNSVSHQRNRLWFPSIPWEKQPLSAIRDLRDPYLNLFRDIIPPIFGEDLSPMLASAVLGALGSILQGSAG